MGLLVRAKQQSLNAMLNVELLLRNQFVEHVPDSALPFKVKQLVYHQTTATLLEVCCEVVRWECKDTPGGVRGRSHSVPLAHVFECSVQEGALSGVDHSPQCSEISELREMLKLQQQLTQLTQSVAQLRNQPCCVQPFRRGSVLCRSCQNPGHFAGKCDREHVDPPSPLLPPGLQKVDGLVQVHCRKTNSCLKAGPKLSWGKY